MSIRLLLLIIIVWMLVIWLLQGLLQVWRLLVVLLWLYYYYYYYYTTLILLLLLLLLLLLCYTTTTTITPPPTSTTAMNAVVLLLYCFRLLLPGLVHLRYLPRCLAHSYFKTDQKPTLKWTVSQRRGARIVMNARQLLKRSTNKLQDGKFLTTSDLALVGSQMKPTKDVSILAEVIQCLLCVFVNFTSKSSSAPIRR